MIKKITKHSFIVTLVVTLISCSSDTVELTQTSSVGPDTNNLLETVPEGLIGDETNASHSAPIEIEKAPKNQE